MPAQLSLANLQALLGSIGSPAGMGMPIVSPFGQQPQQQQFALSPDSMMDLDQQARSPQEVAAKYGVPVEQLLGQYPQYRKQYAGQPAPAMPSNLTNQSQSRNVGTLNPFGTVSNALQQSNRQN